MVSVDLGKNFSKSFTVGFSGGVTHSSATVIVDCSSFPYSSEPKVGVQIAAAACFESKAVLDL